MSVATSSRWHRRRPTVRPLLGALRLLAGHATVWRRRDLQDVAAGLYAAPGPVASAAIRFVNVTLEVRRLAYLHLVTRWRQATSRARYSMSSRRVARTAVSAEHGARRSLSLLCPTRERPRNARVLIDSIRRTAAHPERIEILFYIDSDDAEIARYRALCDEVNAAADRRVRCVPVIGDPMSVSKSWNILAARASGDLLMMANDDQIYVDYAWDDRLDEVARAFPDEIVCLYFDDGQYGVVEREEFAGGDFPIVTRRWYELLGSFTPGLFEFWCNDRWILDVARRAGRLHPIPGVFVDHLHYDSYKSAYDSTYQRHRMTRERSRRDMALYLNTVSLREMAADRLRSAITSREGHA